MKRLLAQFACALLLGFLLVASPAAGRAAQAIDEPCCPPFTGYYAPYAVGYAPYAARYYGEVSPYPIGYYAYPYYGYSGTYYPYQLGYYPYSVRYGYYEPWAYNPYAIGYYPGYATAYFPAWGWPGDWGY